VVERKTKGYKPLPSGMENKKSAASLFKPLDARHGVLFLNFECVNFELF
jgi:hypothetical protein